MAGTIIADFIRTDANQLSLNVGNTTFATINASGFFSNTGTQLIAANGKVSGASVISGSIPGSAISTAANTIPRSSMTSGAILQVVHARSTTTTTVSSTSTFTIVSGTITPSSTSSKILVRATTIMSGAGGYNGALSLYRNSTELGDYATTWWKAMNGNNTGSALISMDDLTTYQPHNMSVEIYDSPATTSACTYDYKVYCGSDSTFYINRYGTGDDPNSRSGYSWITLMEIAG
jgi:hypothetical protein